MPRPKDKCNRKNDRYALMERRKRIASMYVTGKNQWERARTVGVSQGTVSNDLAAIREDWLASTRRDFDARKAEELAKLDQLEAEAWAAWERSCRDSETVQK
jgi:DNA-binding CsgD family transcriptional regulator